MKETIFDKYHQWWKLEIKVYKMTSAKPKESAFTKHPSTEKYNRFTNTKTANQRGRIIHWSEDLQSNENKQGWSREEFSEEWGEEKKTLDSIGEEMTI